MPGRSTLNDDDLGPLHRREPQTILDATYTVVHGPLPTVVSEEQAFLNSLTVGPRYKPRWEDRPAGAKLTWKERAAWVIWGPPFGYMGVMLLIGVYQALTGHLH